MKANRIKPLKQWIEQKQLKVRWIYSIFEKVSSCLITKPLTTFIPEMQASEIKRQRNGRKRQVVFKWKTNQPQSKTKPNPPIPASSS